MFLPNTNGSSFVIKRVYVQRKENDIKYKHRILENIIFRIINREIAWTLLLTNNEMDVKHKVK